MFITYLFNIYNQFTKCNSIRFLMKNQMFALTYMTRGTFIYFYVRNYVILFCYKTKYVSLNILGNVYFVIKLLII